MSDFGDTGYSGQAGSGVSVLLVLDGVAVCVLRTCSGRPSLTISY